MKFISPWREQQNEYEGNESFTRILELKIVLYRTMLFLEMIILKGCKGSFIAMDGAMLSILRP